MENKQLAMAVSKFEESGVSKVYGNLDHQILFLFLFYIFYLLFFKILTTPENTEI